MSHEVITRQFRDILKGAVHDVRVVMINDLPWFVAKDVSDALGLSSAQSAYGRLNPNHISKVGRTDIGMRPGKPAVLICEAGLYDMIMRSDKPAAKVFRDWVVSEVLPSIRKNGAYITGQDQVATGEMSPAEFIAKALEMAQQIAKDAKEKLEKTEDELRLTTIERDMARNELNTSAEIWV